MGGNDTISGGADGDLINGGTGFDQIIGGEGDDSLFGSRGSDIVSGMAITGDGPLDLEDVAASDLAELGTRVAISGSDGSDIVHGGADTDVLIAGDGDTVTGTAAGAQGSADIAEGKVDGNTFTWKQDITVPMPMTLEGTATVEGDSMAGNIKAGAFGEMPFKASKQ